jgi:hypothetical protein
VRNTKEKSWQTKIETTKKAGPAAKRVVNRVAANLVVVSRVAADRVAANKAEAAVVPAVVTANARTWAGLNELAQVVSSKLGSYRVCKSHFEFILGMALSLP